MIKGFFAVCGLMWLAGLSFGLVSLMGSPKCDGNPIDLQLVGTIWLGIVVTAFAGASIEALKRKD